MAPVLACARAVHDRIASSTPPTVRATFLVEEIPSP